MKLTRDEMLHHLSTIRTDLQRCVAVLNLIKDSIPGEFDDDKDTNGWEQWGSLEYSLKDRIGSLEVEDDCIRHFMGNVADVKEPTK